MQIINWKWKRINNYWTWVLMDTMEFNKHTLVS